MSLSTISATEIFSPTPTPRPFLGAFQNSGTLRGPTIWKLAGACGSNWYLSSPWDLTFWWRRFFNRFRGGGRGGSLKWWGFSWEGRSFGICEGGGRWFWDRKQQMTERTVEVPNFYIDDPFARFVISGEHKPRIDFFKFVPVFLLRSFLEFPTLVWRVPVTLTWYPAEVCCLKWFWKALMMGYDGLDGSIASPTHFWTKFCAFEEVSGFIFRCFQVFFWLNILQFEHHELTRGSDFLASGRVNKVFLLVLVSEMKGSPNLVLR